jgi:Zn-dependent peptidase ImmA (M78 family)
MNRPKRSRPSAEIEAKAQQVLLDTACFQVPVPIERVAEGLKLRVEPANLGNDVSGVLVVADGQGTIGYNIDHSEVRYRFSIAHEIGHFMLHQTRGPIFIDKSYTIYLRDENSSSGEHRQEIQANQFAAALLMPEPLIRDALASHGIDLADGTALFTLAERFNVSAQAMTFRLVNLGIL